MCGATGRQGGAVTAGLIERGWQVRALTRRPDGPAAKVLAERGAVVIGADMDDPASLEAAFDGAQGVYSVQNGLTSGFDREVVQGRNVADAAKATGIAHVVYGSAGTGETGTGVQSWDSKLAVEAHMASLGLPVTILRPMAFMELMTDKGYYPAVGTWRIWPKLAGDSRPVPWVSVADLGAIAATAFTRPDDFIGIDMAVVSDVRSLAECRTIYREVMGRDPRTFPMPVWLFDRFTRGDITAIWRWSRTGTTDADTTATRAIVPDALTVRDWLVEARERRRANDRGRGGHNDG